MATTDQT
jgi:hypothetical protein